VYYKIFFTQLRAIPQIAPLNHMTQANTPPPVVIPTVVANEPKSARIKVTLKGYC